VNDQSDNEDDEDWATAFGERIKIPERTSNLRRRQESEFSWFIDDDLDTYFTEHKDGKILTMLYAKQPLY
jgi:hypothetical protein